MNVTTASAARTTRTLTRFRIALMASAAALAVFAGIAVAPAQEAQAATGYGSYTICYYLTTGQPYTGQTIALKQSGTSWVISATMAGTSNGCRTWTVSNGVTVRLEAYQNTRYNAAYRTYFISDHYYPVTGKTGAKVNLGWDYTRQYYYAG